MLKFNTQNKARLRKLIVEMAIIVCVGVVLALGFNRFRSPETRVALLDTGIFAAEDLSEAAIMQELEGLNPITPDMAYAKMQIKPVVFVDSRHPIEYNKGHVAGAVNIPNEFFMDYINDFLDQYPSETILIVYCDGKNCEQSQHLGEELLFAGYTTVYYMEPSWLSWLNSGKPVTIPRS